MCKREIKEKIAMLHKLLYELPIYSTIKSKPIKVYFIFGVIKNLYILSKMILQVKY